MLSDRDSDEPFATFGDGHNPVGVLAAHVLLLRRLPGWHPHSSDGCITVAMMRIFSERARAAAALRGANMHSCALRQLRKLAPLIATEALASGVKLLSRKSYTHEKFTILYKIIITPKKHANATEGRG